MPPARPRSSCRLPRSCPPNPLRIADWTLFAYSSRSREAKREYSAAVSTGAGMPSSIAAIDVQRPSPESDTRPANSASSGDRSSASAVRSSSHDAITLPRRQTSATSGCRSRTGSTRVRQRCRLGVLPRQCLPASALWRMFSPRRRRPSSRTRSRCGPSSRSARRRAGRSAGSPARPGSDRRSGPGVRGGGVDPGGDRGKIGLEPLTDLGLAADHQAEPALQPPDAAAGADVDVVDALCAARRRDGCRRGSSCCRRR